MDEKGITNTVMMNPLVKMGTFGLRKGKEAFSAKNTPGMRSESFGVPPGMQMIGGGGGTNVITGQAKVRSWDQIFSDPTGSKLREKQFNDPQFYLDDEAYKNRRKLPGKKPRRRENRRSYNTDGSIRDFLKLNTGGEVSGSAGIGNKIVEGAKKIIGHKKGVGDMCANTTSGLLQIRRASSI